MATDTLNWVLVRGLSRETRHWAKFPATLQKAYPHSRIQVLELPGVGTKYREPSPTSIEEFSENLRDDFLSLQKEHEGPWGIIAVSLGGMIAMDWVNRYPDDFQCLVTINSSAGNLSGPLDRLSFKAVGKILKLFFRNDLEERERVILELTTRITPITDELVKTWASFGEQYPLSREVFLKQIYAASRFQVPESLAIPFLIICGEGDQLTSPRCSKLLAKHFKIPYQSHPKAGHDLPLEDPEWLSNTISEWQAQCQRSNT